MPAHPVWRVWPLDGPRGGRWCDVRATHLRTGEQVVARVTVTRDGRPRVRMPVGYVANSAAGQAIRRWAEAAIDARPLAGHVLVG